MFVRYTFWLCIFEGLIYSWSNKNFFRLLKASGKLIKFTMIAVQPNSVVTMQSQPATAGPVKVSQAQPIMPQTTMKAHTPIHPHMVSVTNPNAAAASGTTVMRTMADRGK